MDKLFFMNLTRQYDEIKEEVGQAFKDVCEVTAFAGGPFVEKFEKNFAEFCHGSYSVCVNSGTSALHMAAMALGLKEGDEVIIPANTFIATAWAPVYVKATPVFVDCDPETWNIDPSLIEAKITEKTRAIIGVHLYGQPFDVDAVRKIAEKHNLLLIEDCAQAHGARYKDQTVGALTEMGTFSFYPGKNLGAFGEGGAVVTNSEEYSAKIKKLRDHGSDRKYYHDTVGFNMRMDGVQGSILNAKLSHLDKWNKRRKEIADMYKRGIVNPLIKMQKTPEWADSVYHLFVVTTENRDALAEHMKASGIFPGMHYPVPCHLQKAFEDLGYSKGDMPASEYLADHCLSLPMFPELTDEEVNKVIELVNSYGK